MKIVALYMNYITTYLFDQYYSIRGVELQLRYRTNYPLPQVELPLIHMESPIL